MISRSVHGHTADRAYEWIKVRILEGYWPDGAALTESELARAIGVSRTPVREAMRRLTQEGLVETTPNHGSRLPTWTSDDLAEVFSLRLLLESQAAAFAATRVTDSELDHMRRLCQQMNKTLAEGGATHDMARSLTTLNEQFHSAILAAARSPRLQRMATQLISVPLVRRTFATYSDVEVRRSLSQHEELTEALSAGDAVWAKSVMRAHLSAGHHAVQQMSSRIAEVV